jgi:hypothetical protein
MERSGPRLFKLTHKFNALRGPLEPFGLHRQSRDSLRQIGKRATRPAGRASDGAYGQRIDQFLPGAIGDMQELKRRLSDDASK